MILFPSSGNSDHDVEKLSQIGGGLKYRIALHGGVRVNGWSNNRYLISLVQGSYPDIAFLHSFYIVCEMVSVESGLSTIDMTAACIILYAPNIPQALVT
jgi:hypothetical protein